MQSHTMSPNETTNQAAWDAYNELLIGPDAERLRKILVRAELFSRVLTVPGDIVECGVFKGAGLLLWLKLLAIHCPGSAKRVVGFDTFGKIPRGTTAADNQAVAGFAAEAGQTAASRESIIAAIRRAALPTDHG